MKDIKAYFMERKANKDPLVMLTSYGFTMGHLLDDLGLDAILVGDSLGNVFQGKDNTLEVTLEEMIYHTLAVKRAVKNTYVVVDLPHKSGEKMIEDSMADALRLYEESHADALKIEVQPSRLSLVHQLAQRGVPVMGHIGFTPQFLGLLGGYFVQGRKDGDARMILDIAEMLYHMGVFALLMEMVPNRLSSQITEAYPIPTIGIGAGPHCDGQILVTEDLCGFHSKTPRFVKQYGQAATEIRKSVNLFKADVKSRRFPEQSHSFD